MIRVLKKNLKLVTFVKKRQDVYIYIFLVFYTFLFIFVGIELWKEDKKGERKSRGKTGPGWNPGLYIHLTAYRLTAIP